MKKNASLKTRFKKSASAAVASVIALSATVPAFAAERILGDINFDGYVMSDDALAILRHSVGLNLLSESDVQYADMDSDGYVTSNDALSALRIFIYESAATIDFPEQINAICGDRIDLNAKILPEGKSDDVTFTYILGEDISTDGLKDKKGKPFKVIDLTNTGRVRAFHPGESTITVNASNGMSMVCTVTVSNPDTVRYISFEGRSLKINSRMMTNSYCYNVDKKNDFTKIDGVVVHSTATPGVRAASWYPSWNDPDLEKCVHAFLDDKEVWHYHPLDQIAWHAGKPANLTYLGFEICEPSGFYYANNVVTGYNAAAQQVYFDNIWANATLYTAYLCSLYNLTADNVISHGEAGRMGIGTAHGDPDHWFVFHNKNMDDFRAEVARILDKGFDVSEAVIVNGSNMTSGSSETEDVIIDDGISWR
ncbi:MAG: N-acetylmuramoyl-L-alanine amidase [Clostridia bacterium]|nr:N-acetylmuramoyl-L-alanine amidase [Clostridia bacterium]